ncbi:MAG: sporulation protein YtfJ [Clostridia bacterium]|nr:sporulation protein YtfJ [Clostridia bacterium]
MGNVNEMVGGTMQKIKELIDVNAVVGNPITTPDNTTLIPVSKVTFGFASGGTDGENIRFGAGSGAAVSITPMAFIVISGGNVRMIYIDPPTNTSIDKLIDMVPGVIDRFTKSKPEPKSEETL